MITARSRWARPHRWSIRNRQQSCRLAKGSDMMDAHQHLPCSPSGHVRTASLVMAAGSSACGRDPSLSEYLSAAATCPVDRLCLHYVRQDLDRATGKFGARLLYKIFPRRWKSTRPCSRRVMASSTARSLLPFFPVHALDQLSSRS